MYFESFQPQHYLIYASIPKKVQEKREHDNQKRIIFKFYPIDIPPSYLKYKFYG